MSPKGDIWCVLYKGVKSMEPETLFINSMDQLYRMARFMLSDVQDAEDKQNATCWKKNIPEDCPLGLAF